ncbi:3-aminobutyryl-CoA ammonia lyase [Candidatus Izimaplasma bacterium ZiA1]|uniref:3-aminobutyryl-CoA ammonia lyase n=1 Tax=Candidatus Izimoplasma sp. ZiA1 TaxID=2024899 RepID=UPI000BAA3B79|nr:3-aminobutyryl-CoA ammonia lyase [Candidatus Izimaplasma bacterium ZiA1]
METVTIRLRLGSHDAHYGGELVDGAKVLQLFGDVATELLIRNDGDEGLFRAYESVDFLAPLYAGDYIEVTGTIIKAGNTSRKMEFICKKVVTSRKDINESAADFLDEPIITTKAIGTCIVPLDKQRK